MSSGESITAEFNPSLYPSQQIQTHVGVVLANTLLQDLITPLAESALEIQEFACKTALESFQAHDILQKYEVHKKSLKKHDSNSRTGRASIHSTDFDIFSKLSSYTTNQLKNQSIRFSLENVSIGSTTKNSWGLKRMALGSSHSTDSREYEDVLALEIIEAPICDICYCQSGDTIPEGFYRLCKSPLNRKANLNTGSGGSPVYICIKKDLTGQLPPVTNILVIFPDRGEYVPPGYHVVQKGKVALNLNIGTSAEHIYLCFKRDFMGNPLTDLQVIFPTKGEEPPKSFSMIKHSLTGVPANLNTGTSGLEAYLCYRQELTRFLCLLNENDGLDRRSKRSETSVSSINPLSEDGNSNKLYGRNGRSISRSQSPPPHGMRRNSSFRDSRNLDSNDPVSPRNDPASPLYSVSMTTEDEVSGLSTTDQKSINDQHQQLIDNDDAELEAALESTNDVYDECTDAREAELVVIRRTQEIVDSFGNIVPAQSRKALLAFLSAVYVRHGIVSDIAVTGLSRLLKDTDFFEKDLQNLPLLGTITMLDLTIEAICDRFDLSPQSNHAHLLNFLRIVIKHSGGRLSQTSIQRMFRTIHFLCNCYSTNPSWLSSVHQMPCNEPHLEVTPFKVLKQLVWDVVAQVETAEIAHFLPNSEPFWEEELNTSSISKSYLEVRDIVEDMVDDVIDSVDTAKICESLCQTIAKQSLTATSSNFWQQVNIFSRKLFGDPLHRTSFVTICALCKQAWHVIRKNKSGEPIARDLGNKLLALEAIIEFCTSAGEKMRSSKIMGYVIRRIVVPCLLYNVTYALVDHKIFSKILRCITALWKKWRRYARIEFAIFCEQLIFKVLQAPMSQVRPIFQMMVIQEVVNWFDQPHMLIEMFVNYDMDRKFVSHWNTFSYLVRSMCAIGRRLSIVTNAWDWKPIGSSVDEQANKVTVTIRDVHLQALDEVSRMAKTLMDASGHAYLILQDTDFRNRSLGANAGWMEDEGTQFRKSNSGSDVSGTSPNTVKASLGSVRLRREAHEESEELIKAAIKIYQDKNSIKKCVEYLISKSFMPNTPQEIANFLRVYKNNFDPSAIGDFLGEGGVNSVEEEYWAQIRFRYTRAVSFVEMEIEPALRLYLTGCGFRLPGEAQKINRFVEVFVKAFWQDNSGTQYCPFSHSDTIHLVSYAIIMLNTDLHRANIDSKRKTKRMTREEFFNNLRGQDNGKDIDRDYLSRIYDNIASQPIELAVKQMGKESDEEIIAAAAAMLLKEGKKPSDDILQSVLAPVSMNKGGIASSSATSVSDLRLIEEKKFIRDIGLGLRDSEDLLRSLSSFTFHFQITNVDTKISLDLVSFMYETVWFHFHAIVESIFNASSTEMNAKFSALDILCYCLTAAIFLDLKVERMAFASLLKSFRKSCDSMPHVQTIERKIPDDSWYDDVENANEENTMETIGKLHTLMVHIKDTIQESLNYEITKQVAAKFEKRAKVLDNNSYFVRQGDLNKISSKGRPITYRFFLFSDHLIYAHWASMKKEYVVHEQLSLLAMTVADIDTDPNFTSFHVSHPIKSFIAIAESPMAKQQWIREIKLAIVSCSKRDLVSRDVPRERRMSMIGRIEDQQSMQVKERETNILLSSATPERARSRRHSYMNETEPIIEIEELESPSSYVPFSASTTPHNFDMESIDDSGEVAESCEGFKLVEIEDSAAEDTAHEVSEVVIPSAEERAQKQQESIQELLAILPTLPEKSLNSLYNAGTMFWKGIAASRGSNLSESLQLRLVALQRQAKLGRYVEKLLDPNTNTFNGAELFTALTEEQTAAWKSLGEMSEDQAKREFLSELIVLTPYWKYQQFL